MPDEKTKTPAGPEPGSLEEARAKLLPLREAVRAIQDALTDQTERTAMFRGALITLLYDFKSALAED